jgi:hypothetical protein
MKNYTLEQLLISSIPHIDGINTKFTDTVMSHVRQANRSAMTKAIRHSTAPRRSGIFTRLRHLPKIALLLLAVITLLGLTGTAYAIYTLWPKPVINTSPSSKNQFGRTQIIVSFENCVNQQNSTFEIKSKSTLHPDELPKVLQARCEMSEIEKWAQDNKITSDRLSRHRFDGRRTTKAGDIEEWTALSSVGSKVASLTPAALSLTGDEYNTPKEPLTITPETKYIVDGSAADRKDIKPGDTVMYIKWDRSQYKLRGDSTPERPILLSEILESKVLYVIKVGLPFEYYGPIKQNQIVERKPCYGNPQDSCLDGGSVDLYEDLSVSQGYGSQVVDQSATYRHLQAVIQSHKGNVITVKSSSGRIFTLTLPWDILTAFNTSRSGRYNNVKIGVGDMLDINYIEKTNEHATSLDSRTISDVNFVIDFIRKDDPIKKY